MSDPHPVISVFEGHEVRAFFSLEAHKKRMVPVLRKVVAHATECRMVIDYISITPDGWAVVVPKWMGFARFPIVLRMENSLMKLIAGEEK